jgi:hypothetical protein
MEREGDRLAACRHGQQQAAAKKRKLRGMGEFRAGKDVQSTAHDNCARRAYEQPDQTRYLVCEREFGAPESRMTRNLNVIVGGRAARSVSNLTGFPSLGKLDAN